MPLRDPHDRKAFGDMLAAVAEVYGKEITPMIAAIYWSALSSYDLAAVRQAFDRHVKNPDAGQFWPKPADLIRMISGTSVDVAMAAWAIVERSIRRIGGHESVCFDDPLVHRCIDDMGGWPKLCESTEAELPFRARDFTTLYRGFAMRREIPAYPSHLVGRFEAQNVQRGHRAAPPVMVGDAEMCRRVLDGGGGHQLRITRQAESLAIPGVET